MTHRVGPPPALRFTVTRPWRLRPETETVKVEERRDKYGGLHRVRRDDPPWGETLSPPETILACTQFISVGPAFIRSLRTDSESGEVGT